MAITEREKTNHSVIFAESLKQKDHQRVREYLGKDDKYFMPAYVDKRSEKNLLFLFLEYLRPSDFEIAGELEEDWAKLLDVLLRAPGNIRYVTTDKLEDHLFTVIGKNSTAWIFEKITKSVDKKFFDDWLSKKNAEGSTALHYALQARNIQLVEALIQAGIDVNVQDRHGITALYLHLANYKSITGLGLEEQWEKVFDLLLPKADLKLSLKLDPSKYYRNCLHVSAANGQLEIFQRIAKKQGDYFLLHNLLKQGQRNTLSIAIETKSEEIVEFLFKQLEQLYQNGGDDRKVFERNVRLLNHQGENLLHLAARAEFLPPIVKLSRAKFHELVDVNAKNLNGERPIDFTFKRIKKPLMVIEALVGHPKINLGLPLTNGKDLFTNLTQYEVVNAIKIYLNKFTPDWNKKDEDDNPVFLRLLSLKNYDIYLKVVEHFDELHVTETDSLGANITHYLVFYATSKSYLQRLAKKHPALFIQTDQNGQHTLFRAAVASRKLLFEKAEDKEDPVQILLDLGLEFDFYSEEKQTQSNLAHFAVANTNVALFNYIIKHHPDLFAGENHNKTTALHLAAENGSANFVRQILKLPNIVFEKQDERRKYPIHYALESQDVDTIAEFIKAEKMLDVLDPSGKSVVEYLIQDESWEDLVNDYVQLRPASVFDGLIAALILEDFIYVDYFLDKGADPNQKIEAGEFKGLYPIMVPIKLKTKDILNFLVTGFDPEVPDEISPRSKFNFNITDHLGRSLYAYAVMSQDIEILKLLKAWKVPVHPGTVGESDDHISHLLLFTAAFSEWKYGDDSEIHQTHSFLKELFSIKGLKGNIRDRNGDSWAMSALKLNNPHVFLEAIRKWPELLDAKSEGLRAIDLVIQLQAWKVIQIGLQRGFHPNQKYSLSDSASIKSLKAVFEKWGYSDQAPYMELINLGFDTDVILDALDGHFEDDRLLTALEIYIDNYLRECKRVHLEYNQDYRLQKEDRRIYPYTKDHSACFSPSLWKSISESDEEFQAGNVRLR